MQDTIRAAKGIMQDAWSTLDLAGTIKHAPLQNAIIAAAREALKDAADRLAVNAQQSYRPQILVPNDDEETTEWPAHDDTISPPSPIHECESRILPPNTPPLTPLPPPAPAVSPIDGHSVVTGTTARRTASVYNEYMAEILGFLRVLYPFRPHKLNFSDAAGLWNRHKGAGDLVDIVDAAIKDARAAAAATTAAMQESYSTDGQRVVSLSMPEETPLEEVA